MVPHNNLPLLPPRVPVQTDRTFGQAIKAARALAELRGIGNLIPSQTILIQAITLQEAKASSEIEHIVTTQDELYRAFSEGATVANPNTKEVMRYGDAIWHGFRQVKSGKPLSTSLFVHLVEILKGGSAGVRKTPGTVIAARETGEIIYTPPVGENTIRNLLDNLSEYLMTDDDIDPLIKMCVSHYQFEAIHPFGDGNGRTGRVINMLYLIEQNLLDWPVIYPSRYIIENKDEYLRGLRRVTEEGAWEDWVVFMLRGIEESAKNAQSMIIAIDEAVKDATAIAKKKMGRRYSKELIELIFARPYTRIQFVIDAGIAKRDAASMYLRNLEEAGLLVSDVEGRDKYYINRPLMDILTK